MVPLPKKIRRFLLPEIQDGGRKNGSGNTFDRLEICDFNFYPHIFDQTRLEYDTVDNCPTFPNVDRLYRFQNGGH